MDEIEFYTPEEAKAKKAAFAAALLLDPFHPEKAAMSIETRAPHVGYILAVWQYDHEVNAIMEAALTERGVKAKIPTKDEFAASLISEAHNVRDAETRLDYLKLFASVMGYVEKPAAVNLNNTNNTVNNVKNNVILMPSPQDGKSLEAELMEYQARLTAQ